MVVFLRGKVEVVFMGGVGVVLRILWGECNI